MTGRAAPSTSSRSLRSGSTPFLATAQPSPLYGAAAEFFQGRKLLIATKHKKEEVLAPLLEQALGVQCVVAEGLDTDQLGTFSGEVERTLSPLETARAKCRMALEQSGCDLALASEGSFGPHPSLWFLAANEELLLFVDHKNGLEIKVRELSTHTNYGTEEIQTEEELLRFAEKALFPSHALILRKERTSVAGLIKGITDPQQLLMEFRHLLGKYGKAVVETDMRAMHNPSRQAVIAIAAQKLIVTIGHCCPRCGTPGFSISSIRQGLPCRQCARPTPAVASVLYSCASCGHQQAEHYPDHKATEDPANCTTCNP